jgi:hypothetical protein
MRTQVYDEQSFLFVPPPVSVDLSQDGRQFIGLDLLRTCIEQEILRR